MAADIRDEQGKLVAGLSISAPADRQACDQLALIVEDASGHAANPQLQFFVIARCTVVEDFRQRSFKRRQAGDAVSRVPSQTGTGCVGANTLRIVVGKKELADRSEMQGSSSADGTNHLHAGALAVGALDVDDLVALAHGKVHRLVSELVQFAHRTQRGIAHIEARLHEVAQFQQAHSQAVAARFGPVDVATDGEVVQDAVRSGWVESGLLADDLERDRILVGGQHVQQRKHALQHLYRRGFGFGGFHAVDSHSKNDEFCMAKSMTACRDVCDIPRARALKRSFLALAVAITALLAVDRALAATVDEPPSANAPADGASHAQSSAESAPSIQSRPKRSPIFTRPSDRLTSKDIGLVINTADPYSVEVGEFYIHARKLSADHVLRIELPVKAVLTSHEFETLRSAIDKHFNGSTQALALAWTMPYAVSCNSITGALALGFDADLCAETARTCSPSKPSPYFNSSTSKPYASLGIRLSMQLAAKDVAGAKSMIERGVASDHTLGLRGAPSTNAYFVITSDRARSSRAPLFPPSGPLRGAGVAIHTEKTEAIENVDRLMLYETGATHVGKLDTLSWVPGALADHLTSFGGQLDGKSGQMSVLEWIASGATASYGTVSEPCAFQQKFPHPKVLLLHYAQGSTAIEAYWRSVLWPLQGVFIGEPPAAPFAKR